MCDERVSFHFTESDPSGAFSSLGKLKKKVISFGLYRFFFGFTLGREGTRDSARFVCDAFHSEEN